MNPRTLLTLWVVVLGACSSTVEVEVTGRVPERAILEEGMVEILRSARERMEVGDSRGALPKIKLPPPSGEKNSNRSWSVR